MDKQAARAGGPEIAVVIPAYRQPGLLAEALEDVLAQQGAPRHAAVVVDDGCPMPETAETALSYAQRHPGRIFVLRRANGGLSAARNSGIDFALRAWPACRALLMLDADNRLRPHFLARAAAALDAAPPATGWVYPDLDSFGLAQHYGLGGDYSAFLHLHENLCDAGSLIARRVFERGLRFDERLREGFEDWEFWLRANRLGFRGQHLPQAGFLYRKRPESMLAHAERARGAILGGMRLEARAELAARRVQRLEAEELPRFALTIAGEAMARRVTDPLHPRHAPEAPAALRRRAVLAARQPQSHAFPPFWAFASRTGIDLLARLRLLHNVFWQAQRVLAQHPKAAFVLVELVPGPGLPAAPPPTPTPTPIPGQEASFGLHLPAAAPANPARAQLIFARSERLLAAARDPRLDWAQPLSGGTPPEAVTLRATLPWPIPEAELRHGPAPHAALVEEVAALRALAAGQSPLKPEWRQDWRGSRLRTPVLHKALNGCGAVLPWVPPQPGRQIGFVLPLFAFGGVEKVVQNQAAVLRRQGWTPHLFLTGAESAALPAALSGIFETVQFFPLPAVERADTAQRYFAARLPAPAETQAESQAAADALGLLAAMDVVVNTHALAAHPLMGQLRRQGVRTFLGLHLHDNGPLGEPVGNPLTALAYEAGYDGFLLVSRRLADWCAAQGVPRAKLLVVPNAPAYPADPQRMAAALAARQGRDPAAPLKVLFLGRLDAQKGPDRLREIILATRGAPLHWRIAGQTVLDATAPDFSGTGIAIEPPATTAAGLDALYAWADIVLLPSRFEGAPLTIPEAQRFGCVVLATDTGAVAEMLRDGVDGLLLPAGETVVAEAAARLRALAADPARLRAMA
ncbi:glycosyltransferase, partial [Roseomonas sp. GC11]|uniref:glycosyltransferase n=1 Tax=Roseomonas sp. GC11 TaxID=2950546 RepID=UPI00210B9F6D|nr:glycosyltransferase [Roseomonas sp. GC11]